MKLIIFLSSIFIFTITTIQLLTVASSSIEEKEKISMEIIQRILEDPEFIALNSRKQLRLIIVRLLT
jgi:hypothetical protein